MNDLFAPSAPTRLARGRSVYSGLHGGQIPASCSPDQREALEAIREWFVNDPIGSGIPVFRLMGQAGTGKSTVAKHVPGVLGLPMAHYAAPTGKAVNVLTRKGCLPARTLHSLLMSPIDNEGLLEDIVASRKALEGDLPPEERKAISARLAGMVELAKAGPRFSSRAEAGCFDQYGVLIVDEASMVDERLLEALLECQSPIVALGDPYQLPPVKGRGALLSGRFPGYELTQIHRQAENSAVLDLATRIRMSDDNHFGLIRDDFTTVPPAAAVLPRPVEGGPASAIVCYTNSTRLERTEATRAAWGFPLGRPAAGDLVMCAANNEKATGGPLLNGQQFTVTAVGKVLGPEPGINCGAGARVTLTLRGDDGQEREALAYTRALEGRQGDLWFTKAGNEGAVRGYGLKGSTGLFIFAQAITCHRSQGSEWDRIMVMPDWTQMPMRDARSVQQVRRWLYTAATRAATRVVLVKP